MNFSRENRKIERLTREGLESLAANDYESSWQTFEQLLFIDEDHPIANILGAASLLNLGRLEEAEPLARKGVQLTPQLALAHCSLALLLLAKEQYVEAESEIWEAVAIEPHNPEYPLILGRMLFLQSREQEACEQLRRCVELLPQNAEAHFLLGLSLLRCGRISDAKDELEKTLSLQPDNDCALAFDGLLSMAKADDLLTTPPKLAGYRHAAALLRRAVELNPDNELALEWLQLAEETLERISKPSDPFTAPETRYKTLSKQLLVWLGFAIGGIALLGVVAWLNTSFRLDDFYIGAAWLSSSYLISAGIMIHLHRNFSALPPTIVGFVREASKGDRILDNREREAQR